VELYEAAILLTIRGTFQFSQGCRRLSRPNPDFTQRHESHKVPVTAGTVTAPIIGRWRTSSVALGD